MRQRWIFAAALVIAGCGGGGSSDVPAPPAAAPPPPANSAPTIGGTPPTTITEGEAYEFLPTANDADGDSLTFSIANRPDWAAFDEDSGSLTGTPQAANIGTTTDIVISVTDGSETASLPAFDIEVQRIPVGSATVSWDIPTTNADGTMLSDLDGFIVYYGTQSGSYTQSVRVTDPTVNSVVIADLATGTWFFAVSAVDESDNESALSQEVSKVVRP